MLSNISELFNTHQFLHIIEGVDLSKFSQALIQRAVNRIKDRVNLKKGNVEVVLQWINDNCLDDLRTVKLLNELSLRLTKLNLVNSEVESLLTAYQIASTHMSDAKQFKVAVEWLRYTSIKCHYDSLLADFQSSNWQWAYTQEIKKKTLSITFPKAHQLSNGQRDIITLVVQLHKTLHEGSRKPLILIIDEVFDYLDDANLVAFQYYITSIIDAYKERDQTIYPIILTHLDPGVFFDFCFNKHKIQISYLLAKPTGKAKDTLKFIAARDEQDQLKDRLEKCWFHYHTESDEFQAGEWLNNLPDDWRYSEKFHEYTNDELTRYFKGKNYDPLAICFAVRVGIEKLVFDLLDQQEQKDEFLSEVRNTKNKLNFVADRGIDIPETYFLLGLIYNTNLHWNQNRDYVSPLSTKLNHPTIRRLIADIFSD